VKLICWRNYRCLVTIHGLALPAIGNFQVQLNVRVGNGFGGPEFNDDAFNGRGWPLRLCLKSASRRSQDDQQQVHDEPSYRIDWFYKTIDRGSKVIVHLD
jgi:hypothetical protein